MELLQKYMRLTALILLFLAVSACGGDDPQPDPPAPKTPQELITQAWRVVSVIRDGQTLNSSSFKIDFRSNGTYEFTTSEVPGFPQGGNWVYQPSPSGNIIKLEGITDLRVIGQITTTSFVFEYTYTNHKMGDVVVRFTLGPP